MKYVVTLVLTFLAILPMSCLAQATAINRYADTIAYEVKYGRIIIPVEVKGRSHKYILDTGGQTATMWREVEQAKGELTGGQQVTTDMNGQANSYSKATLPEVKIGRYLRFTTLNTIALPEIQGFRDLGVVGILGGDAFKDVVISIDGHAQQLRLFYPYRPKGLKLSDGIPLDYSPTWHVNFPLTFKNQSVQMMFDTGVPELLTLSEDDFHRLSQVQAATVTCEGVGSVGAGLEGLAKPKPLKYVRMTPFTISGKKFENTSAMAAAGIPTILGAELLQYGIVTIDYPRGRFYFQPYETSTADFANKKQTWNVGILPANQRFEITTIWGTTQPQVEIGDEVTAVNGHDITALPLSEMTIVDIFKELKGQEAELTIRRQHQVFKVTIHKL